MSILNFMNQDQLDDLAEEPAMAFMELVNIAQRSLHDQTKDLNEDEQSEWRQIENLRFSFMNVVLASAKRFEIEPFFSMEVPHRKQFGMQDFDQFKYDLDHYVTQLIIDNSFRSKADSVEILPKSKDAILGYVNALRECIEKANLGEKKRDALLKKVGALEAELAKQRVNMMTVARIAFALWAVPGSMWASYDVANKLISNLMHNIAEAKEAENLQKKLPSGEAAKALSPPRKNDQSIFGKEGRANDDLDDDIPF